MMRRACCLLLLAAAAVAGTVSYTYDDAGRLVKVDYGDGRSISYTYDNGGNLLRREVTAPAPPSDTSQTAAKKPQGAPAAARKPASGGARK
jgi:YD repeat-containing protein